MQPAPRRPGAEGAVGEASVGTPVDDPVRDANAVALFLLGDDTLPRDAVLREASPRRPPRRRGDRSGEYKGLASAGACPECGDLAVAHRRFAPTTEPHPWRAPACASVRLGEVTRPGRIIADEWGHQAGG
jgi:hypothetical protein